MGFSDKFKGVLAGTAAAVGAAGTDQDAFAQQPGQPAPMVAGAGAPAPKGMQRLVFTQEQFTDAAEIGDAKLLILSGATEMKGTPKAATIMANIEVTEDNKDQVGDLIKTALANKTVKFNGINLGGNFDVIAGKNPAAAAKIVDAARAALPQDAKLGVMNGYKALDLFADKVNIVVAVSQITDEKGAMRPHIATKNDANMSALAKAVTANPKLETAFLDVVPGINEPLAPQALRLQVVDGQKKRFATYSGVTEDFNSTPPNHLPNQQGKDK